MDYVPSMQSNSSFHYIKCPIPWQAVNDLVCVVSPSRTSCVMRQSISVQHSQLERDQLCKIRYPAS